jgi:hypothetical protein
MRANNTYIDKGGVEMVATSIRLPSGLRNAVAAEARKNHRSFSGQVVFILSWWMAQRATDNDFAPEYEVAR